MILEQLVVLEDVEDAVDMNDVACDETANDSEGESDPEDGELDHGLEHGDVIERPNLQPDWPVPLPSSPARALWTAAWPAAPSAPSR